MQAWQYVRLVLCCTVLYYVAQATSFFSFICQTVLNSSTEWFDYQTDWDWWQVQQIPSGFRVEATGKREDSFLVSSF